MTLKVSDLQVVINDNEIINNINFEILENELVMILGVNGAGKTTLMKTLLGLIKANKGTITIDNKDITKLSIIDRAKLMSYIPQNSELNLRYTVKEFVAMGITPYLGVFDMPSDKHEALVIDALKKLNIENIQNSYFDSISGGEKQIAYLARNIMQGADIMILDEPTAYLDFKRQHIFLEIVKEFIKENNKSAILTVHDPNLALRYADKIIVIDNSTVLKVIEKKSNDYQSEFLNALNQIYDNKLRLIDCGASYMVVWE